MEIRPDMLRDIIGQQEAKQQISSAIMCRRNFVIYGPPGIGKTTIAKNIAALLPEITVNDCDFNCLPDSPVCPSCRSGTPKTRAIKGIDRFVRIQGSPDLAAEDLLGDIDPVKAMKFGATSIEAFTPGKIFKANNGVLFFDELNRCPEKLQNALLQVLEEQKATIGSYDIDIPADFLFIATMNPYDISTEKLSDVLLDRFDVIYMTYPEAPDEKRIVQAKGGNIATVPGEMLDLIIGFVQHLRNDDKLEKMPSVRASIGLFDRSQANAKINSRDIVQEEDIKASLVSVLAHRIRLKPSAKYTTEPDKHLLEQYEEYTQKGGAG